MYSFPCMDDFIDSVGQIAFFHCLVQAVRQTSQFCKERLRRETLFLKSYTLLHCTNAIKITNCSERVPKNDAVCACSGKVLVALVYLNIFLVFPSSAKQHLDVGKHLEKLLRDAEATWSWRVASSATRIIPSPRHSPKALKNCVAYDGGYERAGWSTEFIQIHLRPRLYSIFEQFVPKFSRASFSAHGEPSNDHLWNVVLNDK